MMTQGCAWLLCRGLEEALHYSFASKGAAVQAITHCSYPEATSGCYQRLEFLGDAALDLLITKHSYSEYRYQDHALLSVTCPCSSA